MEVDEAEVAAEVAAEEISVRELESVHEDEDEMLDA